jgi:ribosomal protein L16 Arg81 hydroxylase
MTKSLIARLLAPITVAQFKTKYLNQRALYVRGKPTKFDFLFTRDDFSKGLDRVTDIRAVFKEFRQAFIRPTDMKDMIRAGATICVTGMEKGHEALKAAATQIREELGYPGSIDFRAYISPPGKGFEIHYDNRVATTLQIHGEKRWWFTETSPVPFPAQTSTELPADQLRPPSLKKMRTVVLKPGDFLSLPPGAWHRAEAQSTSLSLNLAMNANGMTVLDAVMRAVRPRLAGDVAWRTPLACASTDALPDEIASDLRARIAKLSEELSRLGNDPKALEQVWRVVQGKS